MNTKKKSSDLYRLREDKDGFIWGIIMAFHRIGDYDIAEYLDNNSSSVRFHVWVGGQSTSTSYLNLDAAIVGAVAHKHEGPNHRADFYFAKALNI